MPIGTSDEHRALHEAVAGWAKRHCPPAVPRAVLDADTETMPPFWDELAAQGWLGLHVDEASGGNGYGFAELVVVLEELGRVGAPGPYLSTVLASAVLACVGGAAAAELLPALAAGATPGAVALSGTGSLAAETIDGRGLRVSGTIRPVLSGHLAGVVLASAGATWVALAAGDFDAVELPSVDLTRRVAEVRVDAVVPPERRLDALTASRVDELATVLFAAECGGGAQWCVETAAAYARERQQFGRPIGQFQAVKHRCADMACRTELARAATWDAARAVSGPGVEPDAASLTAWSAGALAIEGNVQSAKDCVQVLGGIGFTWEHDAHRYLRRAIAVRQLALPVSTMRVRAATLAAAGARRRLGVDLPVGADEARAEVATFAAEVSGLAAPEQRERLADAGYLAPHWPAPWGRDAGPVEQLVVDDELRRVGIRRPHLAVGAWALPPLMLYGTDEQQQRWIPPTLRGDFEWCQLFSEPGAGSDLASLSTRAARVEGGWLVNGQKVWTSMAHQADWGILLARTDPDAPKHDGISFFMLDMRAPGIDIRPLRELTGEAWFNEVFLDDVFVPEDCLVGGEHDGWRVTRTSLANERVSMGSGTTLGGGVRGVLELIAARGLDSDPVVMADTGELVVREHALAVLGFRLTLASLAGADPSAAEASVRKLLGVEHDQCAQELGLALLGPEGATADGEAAGWSRQFLWDRCLTIAGGTSEIQRNIIAERVLGLPRDG